VWLAVIDGLSEQIERLERTILDHAVLEGDYRMLTTIPGVGAVLASTIEYETGEIGRFPGVRQYASYCRLVKAEKTSNQRIKGEGLRRNGNPYLSRAFHEAAHFAVRFQPKAKRWYERKRSKSCALIAIRAVAHKLAPNQRGAGLRAHDYEWRGLEPPSFCTGGARCREPECAWTEHELGAKTMTHYPWTRHRNRRVFGASSRGLRHRGRAPSRSPRS
jgi:hypothetical protein